MLTVTRKRRAPCSVRSEGQDMRITVPVVRLITLPSGRRVTLAEYVRSWQAVKAIDPGTLISGFDYVPVCRERILAEMSRAVHARINIRGGIVWPDVTTQANQRRFTRRYRARLDSERIVIRCRCCGERIPPEGFNPNNSTHRLCVDYRSF